MRSCYLIASCGSSIALLWVFCKNCLVKVTSDDIYIYDYDLDKFYLTLFPIG